MNYFLKEFPPLILILILHLYHSPLPPLPPPPFPVLSENLFQIAI